MGGHTGGHTNLIGDSSLHSSDAKPSTNYMNAGKPLLQLKRHVLQPNIAADCDGDTNSCGDNSSGQVVDNGQGGRIDCANSRSSTPDTFLIAGNAEKAFFDVCSGVSSSSSSSKRDGCDVTGKDEEDTNMHSKYSDNVEDDSTNPIKVVSQILGEIEVEHQEDLKHRSAQKGPMQEELVRIDNDEEMTFENKFEGGDKTIEVDAAHADQVVEYNKGGEHEHSISKLPTLNAIEEIHGDMPNNIIQKGGGHDKISTSLVVDIHIPPTYSNSSCSTSSSLKSSADVKLMEGGNGGGGDKRQKLDRKVDSATFNNRPCKHELSRFQRCYSDTSQIKHKRKVQVSVYDAYFSLEKHKIGTIIGYYLCCNENIFICL